MDNLFNKKVLYVIPVIFFIIIIFRISYSYQDVKEKKYNFALTEAQVLNTYALVHRSYYQKFFLDKTIDFNSNTLPALPAYSSYPISKTFSQDNPLNITIRTVSDRARNYNNQADSDEMKAINFFNKEITKEQYFSEDNNDYYQFAYALKIEQKCLKCHGKKENAPLFLQQRYQNAYDYKLGELRGIQSIRIPKNKVNDYFMESFFYAVIYDIALFIILFIAIFILQKKTKSINDFLQKKVEIKTDELKKQLVIDRLTGLPNRLRLLEDIENKSGKKQLFLALLNIDRFKDINDFYGYDIGDRILKEIARTIQRTCINKKSFIYKLPSDEFAILSTRDISEVEFHKIIKIIITKLQNTQININEHSIFVSLSSGISSNKEALLATADMALKVSKETTSGTVIYSSEIDKTDTILQNINGISLIKDSFTSDNFQPYFQPIYNHFSF